LVPVVNINNLSVIDVDNTNLTSATISITDYDSNLVTETLTADTAGTNISANRGVLSLSGNTTLAEYQQVLRTVTYQSSVPVGNERSITFAINNGLANSAVVTTTLTIISS